MSNLPGRRLYRVREAAEIMGLSRSALYAMVYSKQLLAIRCGGKGTAIRIPAEVIDEWIAEQKARAARGTAD